MGNKQSAPMVPSATKKAWKRSLARLRVKKSATEGANADPIPAPDPVRRHSAAASSVVFQREVLSDSRQLARVGSGSDGSQANVIMMPESSNSDESSTRNPSARASLGIPAEDVLNADSDQLPDRPLRRQNRMTFPEQGESSRTNIGVNHDTSQSQIGEFQNGTQPQPSESKTIEPHAGQPETTESPTVPRPQITEPDTARPQSSGSLVTTGPQASESPTMARPQTAESTATRPQTMARSQTTESKGTGSQIITPSQTIATGSRTITPSQTNESPAGQSRTSRTGQWVAEQNGNDPDAITRVPPAEQKPAPSAAVSAHEDATVVVDMCGICGQDYGHGNGREQRAYLPCGHWFGIDCLFNWIVGGEDGQVHQCCPNHDCITLRHACEHVAMPTLTWPDQAYRNTSAPIIPWNYEFCKTAKGRKIFQKFQNGTHDAVEAEAARADSQFWLSQAYWQTYSGIRRWRRDEYYKELERKRNIWWRRTWMLRWNKYIEWTPESADP